MAISYVSDIVKGNPFVQPFDINLMTRVNTYKQGQFYTNAAKFENLISELNNADVYKDDERDYLRGKVNNLVSQINNMGAINYSDMNIANTLQTYGSDIYADPTVITAISSTKKVREYLKNNEAVKNDPKLNKYYSSAREWYDLYNPNNPNSLVNYKNSKFGEAYSGPTAPAPYLGNDWELLTKEIQKINPDIVERIEPMTGNKYFYDISKEKRLTREDIRSFVDGKIDGKIADQLRVNAAYNYHGLTNGTFTKEQAVDQFNKVNTDGLAEAKSVLKQYQDQLDTIVDEDLKQKVQSDINYYKDTVIPAYEQALTKGVKDFGKIWDSNREAAYYALYTEKLKNDISDVYSYSEKTHRLVVNQKEVINARLELEALKKGMTLTRNADGSISFTPKAGSGGTAPFSGLEPDNSTTADLNKKEVNLTSLKNDIQDVKDETNRDFLELVTKDARYNNVPGLLGDNIEFGGGPNNTPTYATNLIAALGKIKGDRNLDKEDLEELIRTIGSGETSLTEGKYPIKRNGELIISITPKQVEYLKNKLQFWNDAADENKTLDNFSSKSEWGRFFENYTIRQNAIKNKENLIHQATRQALSSEYAKAKLTDKEKLKADEFFTNPEQYIRIESYTGGGAPGTGGSAELLNSEDVDMKSALYKLGYIANTESGFFKKDSNSYKENINKSLKTLGDRKNYYNVILPDRDKDLKDMYLGIDNYIASDKDFSESGIKDINDIAPVAIVTDGDGNYKIKYTNAKKVNSGFYYADLDAENQKKFGVQGVPYPYLEQVVSQNKKLFEPILYRTDNRNIVNPLRIQVYNENYSNVRNRDSFRASIVYKGQDYFFFPEKLIPGGESQLKLANSALQGFKLFIDNFQGSFDQLLAELKKYTNQ